MLRLILIDAPLSSSLSRYTGVARFAAISLARLYELVERCYQLGVSLPSVPLQAFQKATAQLPRTTEAERLQIQRIGQGIFRKALLDYWGGKCPLTGISHPALLRASHIIPWAECDDAKRLDVHNGLLLSCLWDAAFDQGLLSFSDTGEPIVSADLSAHDMMQLSPVPVRIVNLTDGHRANLAYHRAKYGFA